MNLNIVDAVDFYKHKENWTNRLIAGDSLLVMNSLLEKEGLGGTAQVIYIDPPYGIGYRSNFQPFVNKRDPRDNRDEDLTREPEMIRAFRDTWELGIHTYLTYLRDRFLLAKDLLTESGSIFVQISDENLDLVKALMREIFGAENFVSIITFTKAPGGLESTKRLSSRVDYIVWFARNREKLLYRPIFEERDDLIAAGFTMVEQPDGVRRNISREERRNPSLLKDARLFRSQLLTKSGPGSRYEITHEGRTFTAKQRWWGMQKTDLEALIAKGRVMISGDSLRFVRYADDFTLKPIGTLWDGFAGASNPIYAVQTNAEIVKRCLLMTSDPGDLVFDPTCGSGTTAVVAEEWGRRWITCDTSRVAITLAKQRLMTAALPYYELSRPAENIDGGIRYRTVPHVTPTTIAGSQPPKQETLVDQPLLDSSRVRVAGPFTVEAVPAATVIPLMGPRGLSDDVVDNSVARDGITAKHSQWRGELLRSGMRGRSGDKIEFLTVDPFPGGSAIHASAMTAGEVSERIVISFGPEYGPLSPKQVERAWQEARHLLPLPAYLVFAAFQFDPEAARAIDEATHERMGMHLLKAWMNGDLFTEDLLKKRASNESFWLIGQPEIELRRTGSSGGFYEVEVLGFDYFDVRSGAVQSGDQSMIAMWLLDTDYDERSMYPRQYSSLWRKTMRLGAASKGSEGGN